MRAVRGKRFAAHLGARRILLDTALGREVEWLIMTALLELPFRQRERVSEKDALAEFILASPHVREVSSEALQGIGQRPNDPAVCMLRQ